MKTVSIAQAKDRLTELLYEAEDGRPVQVTRRGKAVAVLMSESEYERLLGSARPDFAAWSQGWRARQASGFEGVTGEELDRWADY
ncbi:MAG: Antitoxin [Hydrocarboniphaga sp.]|uniref:type II toxin-antitoxin system Phd/YefM family antitoxin n=1 Tax=Hydrocarboniphaga sp. TaxID=2033016 RepID=UPI0026357B20|nr:type II toxin-antitoxin system Phd/YefM family antitoxin [Hydrocarboniphaga sp.]MDB5971597.1 Antitoxin [Hydrocarboniphaga sp.]